MSSFFEASGIEQWSRTADQELQEAFEGAHNRVTVTPIDRRLLTRSAADRLLAVNAYSRIALGRYLCEEIANQHCVNDHWEHDQPIFLGTLIPKEGLVRCNEPAVDIGNMKRRLQADLRGFDYIGMFEPGFYASLPSTDSGPRYEAICWHPHLLTWDVTADQAASLTEKLRKSGNYQAVVEEFQPVHSKQVANGELPDVVRYLLKPPSHAYRVTRYPWVDQDGKVRLKQDGTPRFYVGQRSSNLRKGERVTVFQSMKHLGLEELLVAGGQGSALRSRALHKATREFDSLRSR